MTSARTVAQHYHAHMQAAEQAAAAYVLVAHHALVASLTTHVSLLIRHYGAAQAALRHDNPAGRVPVAWLYEQSRLQRLETLTLSHTSAYAGYVEAAFPSLLHSAVQLGRASAAAQYEAVTRRPATLTPLFSAGMQVGIEGAAYSGISSLQLAQQTQQKVHDALVVGVALGMTAGALASRVARALDFPRWGVLGALASAAWNLYRGRTGRAVGGK